MKKEGKKRFSDLAVGDVFIICDDSEFYITGYKVDADYYISSDHSFRQKAADIEVPGELKVVGKVQLHDTPTDIERAACTMLMRARASHPILQAWIKQILSIEGFYMNMREWWLSIKDGEEGIALAKMCLSEGRYPLESNTPFSMNEPSGSALSARICDLEAVNELGSDSDEFKENVHYRNRAEREIYCLAKEIITYREGGRKDGDYSSSLHVWDTSSVCVVTSLAAKIAEYHEKMLSIEIDKHWKR